MAHKSISLILNKDIPLDSHELGMPIVKQLIELMKGEMRIESEKGRVTKVILSFSLDEDLQKTTITQIYAV